MSRTYRRKTGSNYLGKLNRINKEYEPQEGEKLKTLIWRDGRRETVLVKGCYSDEVSASYLRYVVGDYQSGAFRVGSEFRRIKESEYRAKTKERLQESLRRSEAEDYQHVKEITMGIGLLWF